MHIAFGIRHNDEAVLLSELSHRIRNEYAALIGHLRVAERRTPNVDAKSALTQAVDAIRRYAALHDALQKPQHDEMTDLAGYLNQLCQALRVAKLQGTDVSLSTSVGPISLPASHCWRLGLIVYELVTNSVRHAFERRGCNIWLEVQSYGSLVQCTLSDDGMCDQRAHPGTGLGIVRSLAEDLRGIVNWTSDEGGTSVKVTFPFSSGLGDLSSKREDHGVQAA